MCDICVGHVCGVCGVRGVCRWYVRCVCVYAVCAMYMCRRCVVYVGGSGGSDDVMQS